MFNELYGNLLLNQSFFDGILDKGGAWQGELIKARTRQAVGNYGTKTALAAMGSAAGVIGGGELIALAPAIGNGISTASWNAGAAYNAGNIIMNHYSKEAAWYLASRGVPILFSKQAGQIGKDIFYYLTRYHHGKAGRDVTIQEVVKTGYDIYRTTDKLTQ
jgi:hypothetical protein